MTKRVCTYRQSSTELTIGLQQIDIVTSHKVLGQTNNRGRQTDFTVMVCRLFRDITSQLRDLDLLDDTFLETSKQDLSLTRLETVSTRGNRSDVVGHGKENELFVDEVCNRHRGDVVIQVCPRLPSVLFLHDEPTLNCLNHSFRSSAFFLLNAMSISARSSGLMVSKASRCLSRSLKYFFASADVLVPRP